MAPGCAARSSAPRRWRCIIKLCHVLGGTFDLPHAEMHAVLLPHTIVRNGPAAPAAMHRVARALDTHDVPARLFDLVRDGGGSGLTPCAGSSARRARTRDSACVPASLTGILVRWSATASARCSTRHGTAAARGAPRHDERLQRAHVDGRGHRADGELPRRTPSPDHDVGRDPPARHRQGSRTDIRGMGVCDQLPDAHRSHLRRHAAGIHPALLTHWASRCSWTRSTIGGIRQPPNRPCSGPFHVADAPHLQMGDSISRTTARAEPLHVSGVVLNESGAPIEGALLDVWQTSHDGF